MTSAATRLPRVLGVSLEGLRGGPLLFHAADGRQVARADPEGAGWWWLRVGDDEAPALVAPPQGRLLALDLTEVASIRVSWSTGELTVDDRVLEIVPRTQGPGGCVRWRGVDAVSVHLDSRAATVEHIGVLSPAVTVFVVTALLRWAIDSRGLAEEILHAPALLGW